MFDSFTNKLAKKLQLHAGESDLDSDERETIKLLFDKGPIWDGNVPSKASRDNLVDKGLAFHAYGFASLTQKGLQWCDENGLTKSKS